MSWLGCFVDRFLDYLTMLFLQRLCSVKWDGKIVTSGKKEFWRRRFWACLKIFSRHSLEGNEDIRWPRQEHICNRQLVSGITGTFLYAPCCTPFSLAFITNTGILKERKSIFCTTHLDFPPAEGSQSFIGIATQFVSHVLPSAFIVLFSAFHVCSCNSDYWVGRIWKESIVT